MASKLHDAGVELPWSWTNFNPWIPLNTKPVAKSMWVRLIAQTSTIRNEVIRELDKRLLAP